MGIKNHGFLKDFDQKAMDLDVQNSSKWKIQEILPMESKFLDVF